MHYLDYLTLLLNSQDSAISSAIDTNETLTIEAAIDLAKRAFALKKYEEAVEHYSNALEIA